MGDADPNPDDTLSVLIASDTHLGYNEKDPIRGDDSFNTFDEIFRIAVEKKVDMVLLAGDLFHENKPSRKSLKRCMEILRDHCLGDREVKLCCLSDQKTNFHDKYKEVNYENPNYNVQLPVFSIHGNHDDPTGDGGLAALDLLSVANFVNYFGKADNFDQIELSPVLIQKGATKLALYGLGHVRDERLSRCFERKSVTVCRPADDEEEWFSVLALHQNRHQRGAGQVVKGYVHEAALPSCMDLVVWGHEHECQLAPDADGNAMPNLTPSVHNPNFTVIQPGSSVATALVDGESRPKHVAILQLHKQQWKLDAIPLRTVRPFLMRDVTLADHDGGEYDLQVEADLTEFLVQQVDAMLAEVAEKNDQARGTALTAADESLANFPLLRLKINYSGYGTINPAKFGARFVEKVANPSDILLFSKKSAPAARKKPAAGARRAADGEGGGEDEVADEINPAEEIQGLVKDFLDDGKSQLRILNEGEMNLAVFDQFVARDERGSIDAMVKKQCKQLIEQITKEKGEQIFGGSGGAQDLSRKDYEKKLEEVWKERGERARAQRSGGAASSSAAGSSRTAAGGRRAAAAADGDDDGFGDYDDDMMGGDDPAPEPSPAPARGRGRGGKVRRGGERPRPRQGARRRRQEHRRAEAAGEGGGGADRAERRRRRRLRRRRAAEAAAEGVVGGGGAAASRPKRQKTAKKYDESDDDVDDDDDSDAPVGLSPPASSRAASSRSFAGRRVR